MHRIIVHHQRPHHPNEGSVDVIGKISSLLTLGAGFDQDLTGRDNIRLAGAFLGSGFLHSFA